MTFLTFFPAKFDIYFLKQQTKLKLLLFIFPPCFSYQFNWRSHLSKLDKINAWIKKDEVMIFENSTKWLILTRVVSIVCRNISILGYTSFSILCWSCIRIHFIPQKRVSSTWEEERWRTGAKFIENMTIKLRELKRISWKQFEKDNNKFFNLVHEAN